MSKIFQEYLGISREENRDMASVPRSRLILVPVGYKPGKTARNGEYVTGLHDAGKFIQTVPDHRLCFPRVTHMTVPLVLASGSAIRAQLLENAGLRFRVEVPRVDEDAIRRALIAEDAAPRDIADTLAEMKARKISEKTPGALVIGCDQVLDFEGALISKPDSPEAALDQLKAMRGKRHKLLSAVVVYHDGAPVWRHVGQVRLTMRDATDAYLSGYVARNWDSIRHSVGGYKLEEEGVRLFTAIDGDYFTVLGMPLLELLSFLTTWGAIET